MTSHRDGQASIPTALMPAVAELKNRIAVAMGKRAPDLVLKGAEVVDVHRARIVSADIAIAGRRIAAVRADIDTQGARVIDCRGLIAGPGFVEPHMHLETTFVSPRQLARAIVPRGTTTLFADGTDASYVGGARAVKALFESVESVPMRVFLEAPSYSAFLPELQTVGGAIDLAAANEMLHWKQTVSLGEVVASRVVDGDDEYLAKVAMYRQAGKRINGHSETSRPEVLDAFVSAGVIDDHTSWSGESLEDRLSRGMTLFLVEAPGRRRLSAMLKHVRERNLPTRALCLCIDNISIFEIVRGDYGYLDYPVSLAVQEGIDPIEAIQMASLNPAAYYGRDADLGSLAPGRLADIQLWPDLKQFRPHMVLYEGQLVAEDGKLIRETRPSHFPDWYLNSIQLPPDLTADQLLAKSPLAGAEVRARVIHLPGAQAQALNEERWASLPVRNGKVNCDPVNDLVSICVIERYGRNGNIGYGYLSGSGLKQGALATSVSISDSNVLVMGCDSHSMWTAVRAVSKTQGGFAVAVHDKVLGTVAAPVGGQMSDAPFEDFLVGLEDLVRAAHELGCTLENPFLTMASTVLMSVPDLGLSDCGYIDARTGMAAPTFLTEEPLSSLAADKR